MAYLLLDELRRGTSGEVYFEDTRALSRSRNRMRQPRWAVLFLSSAAVKEAEEVPGHSGSVSSDNQRRAVAKLCWQIPGCIFYAGKRYL